MAVLILLTYKSALNWLYYYYYYYDDDDDDLSVYKKIIIELLIVVLYFEVDFSQYIGTVTISTSTKNKLTIIIIIDTRKQKECSVVWMSNRQWKFVSLHNRFAKYIKFIKVSYTLINNENKNSVTEFKTSNNRQFQT